MVRRILLDKLFDGECYPSNNLSNKIRRTTYNSVIKPVCITWNQQQQSSWSSLSSLTWLLWNPAGRLLPTIGSAFSAIVSMMRCSVTMNRSLSLFCTDLLTNVNRIHRGTDVALRLVHTLSSISLIFTASMSSIQIGNIEATPSLSFQHLFAIPFAMGSNFRGSNLP